MAANVPVLDGNEKPNDTPRQAAIGFIFVTLVIDVTGFGIIIPVVPRLIQELTHGSMSLAATYGGWLIASYAITQFVFAPIVGGLSDQYGRRKVLLASLFGFFLDYLFVAFAPNILWLFVGRIVAGVRGQASRQQVPTSPTSAHLKNVRRISGSSVLLLV